MILDKIADGNFIFKNTYAENKQVQIAVDADEAPEEFFFIHIEPTPSVKTRFKKTIGKLFE